MHVIHDHAGIFLIRLQGRCIILRWFSALQVSIIVMFLTMKSVDSMIINIIKITHAINAMDPPKRYALYAGKRYLCSRKQKD